MNNMKCDTVKDLLPLYIDNICSESSRKSIEEHFTQCSKCHDIYKMMTLEENQMDVQMENFMEAQPFKKLKKKQKNKTRILLLSLLGCLAVCLLLLFKNFSESHNQLSFEAETTDFHEVLQKINEELNKKWGVEEKAILELSGSAGLVFAPATGMDFHLYAEGKQFDVSCTCYGGSKTMMVYINRRNTEKKGYGIVWKELLEILDEVETKENLEEQNYILLIQPEDVNPEETVLAFYKCNPEEKNISNLTVMQYSIPVISIEMSE